MIRLNISLPDRVVRQADNIATDLGLSRSALISYLIMTYNEAEPQKESDEERSVDD